MERIILDLIKSWLEREKLLFIAKMMQAVMSAIAIANILDIGIVSIYPIIIAIICGYLYLHFNSDNVYVKIIAGIFSIFMLLGNIESICETAGFIRALNILIIVFGSYFLFCWVVGQIFVLYDRQLVQKDTGSGGVFSALSIGIISFISIVIIWFLIWLSEYPGVLTPDSIWQTSQILGLAPLHNHHPVAHTLWIKLWYIIGQGLGIKGNEEIFGFISLVQLILLAVIFSFEVVFVYKKTKKFLFACLSILFYSIVSYNGFYSVTLWKDVIHGGITVLFIIAIYSYLEKADDIKKKRNYFSVIVTLGIAFSLFRSNGYYAFWLWFIMIGIYIMKKRDYFLLGTLFLIIVTSTIIKGPIYSQMGVIEGSIIEKLSIPVQQIANVITNERYLESNEKELLSKVVDLEEVPKVYADYISDPIKNICNVGSDSFVKHKMDYFLLWIKLGLRYPEDYLIAYIKQTCGYWYPDTSYWVYATGVTPNDMNIEKASLFPEQIVKAIEEAGGDVYQSSLYCAPQIPLYGSLFNLGTVTWILICMILYVFYRKRWSLFISYLLLICVFISLMISTPVYAEFRYYYSIVACLPLILFLPLSKEK